MLCKNEKLILLRDTELCFFYGSQDAGTGIKDKVVAEIQMSQTLSSLGCCCCYTSSLNLK